MELRVLHYFLTVARLQSFTKAAIELNITQPTLSRQIAELENELNAILFNRNAHGVTLTKDGILLKRRALEMIDLENQIIEDFKTNNEIVEGRITIGCGEFNAIELLSNVCKSYNQKYPKVQIALHTATADVIYELMQKGLVDIGFFLEPVNTENLDYIRIENSDQWVVSMNPDDPLVKKDKITKDDLLDKPLILPERINIQSELLNWFKTDLNKLNVIFTSNLGTNAAIMANKGLGYSLSIKGAGKYWRNELLIQKELYPPIKVNTIIGWRRNIPYPICVTKFIEELHAL